MLNAQAWNTFFWKQFQWYCSYVLFAILIELEQLLKVLSYGIYRWCEQAFTVFLY